VEEVTYVKSLRIKITVVFNILILLVGLIVSIALYHSSVSLVTKSIGTQAKMIAQNAAAEIDAEEYKKVVEKVKENPGKNVKEILKMNEYKKIRVKLAEIKKQNGLSYLYTMSKINEKNSYIIDGYPLSEKKELSLPGDVESIKYDDMIRAFSTQKAQVGQLTYDKTWGANISTYVPLRDKNGTFVGIVGGDYDATNVYKMMQKTKRDITLITIVAVLVSMIVSFVLSSYLTKSLKQLAAKMKEVRNGNIMVEIEHHQKDEIGQVAKTFKKMLQEIGQMIRVMKKNTDVVNAQSSHLNHNTEVMEESTEQMVTEIQRLKMGSENQLEAVEHSMSIVKSISEEIQDIADYSKEASVENKKIDTLAQKGEKQLKHTTSKMKEIQQSQKESSTVIADLEEKSKQIDEIVVSITDIATQTNLLALNASIEAARAGEHGKGFSVVADEVKKLAEQSSQSASKISDIIKAIHDSIQNSVLHNDVSSQKIEEGTEEMEKSGEIFLTIMDSIAQINEKIENIARASDHLLESNKQAAQGFIHVKEIAESNLTGTSQFQEMMEEQKQIAHRVSQSTNELMKTSKELQTFIQKFNTEN